MRKFLLVAISVIAATAVLHFAWADSGSTANKSIQPPIGANCSVRFRNDVYAHGDTSNLVIGGRVKSVSEEWLVIVSSGSDFWIPRHVILTVEITPSA